MEKFTREYAESKGDNYIDELSGEGDFFTVNATSYANGYMKAIEETNATELLEALKMAHNLLPNSDFKRDLAELINKSTL
jgi:hypothetical protein